ncbi:MAG: AMP-binding protein, partial [Chloroflexota bacterium]
MFQPITVHHLLEVQTTSNPDGIAIMAPGRKPLTYGQLFVQVSYVVATLNALGIGRNEVVAVVLPNGPEMGVAFLSVVSGATIAPLNPSYRLSEFEFYLSNLKAKAVIVQLGIDSPVRTAAETQGIPIIELDPALEAEAGIFTLNCDQLTLPPTQTGFAWSEDVSLLLQTSGTTAKPKIVPLSHINICASARNISTALALTPMDRCLNVMPLYHIHGLSTIFSSIAAGASIVCTPGFYAPKFFEWVELFRPTWYTAAPAIHQSIVSRAAEARDSSTNSPFRFVRSASSPLPESLITQLETNLNTHVIEAYGMTEAAPQIASNPLQPHKRKKGSVGLARGPKVAIMDQVGNLLPPNQEGEVVIRGNNVMSGYVDNPAANEAAFVQDWFRTGDQGYLDQDEYLFITGRLRDLINRGGEKISPYEVDEILLKHPAVAETATFAIPDDKLGEDVAAAIVLHDGATISEKELRSFVAAHLADFKVPRQIAIVDQIPRSDTNKIK